MEYALIGLSNSEDALSISVSYFGKDISELTVPPWFQVLRTSDSKGWLDGAARVWVHKSRQPQVVPAHVAEGVCRLLNG